jgi:hypothetical protein
LILAFERRIFGGDAFGRRTSRLWRPSTSRFEAEAGFSLFREGRISRKHMYGPRIAKGVAVGFCALRYLVASNQRES